MKKNYLVVDTRALCDDGKYHYFTHFINLKGDLTVSILEFVNHLKHFKGQEVERAYFSEDRLTNW